MATAAQILKAQAKAAKAAEPAKAEAAAKDTAYSQLNAQIPKGKAAKEQRYSFLGSLGKEATSPSEYGMPSQLRKQMGKARSRISNNQMHGLAMDRIGDEIAGRVARAVVGDETAAAKLRTASAHIDEARAAVRAHQAAHGAGNVNGAITHLVRAGGHLAAAVNSIPEEHRHLLQDNLSFYDNRTRTQTPWRTPKDEDPVAHADFTSLENVHKDINNIMGAYKEHVKDAGVDIPEKMPDLPTATPKTSMPLSEPAPSLMKQVYAQDNRTAGMAQLNREAAQAAEPKREKKKRPVTPATIPGVHAGPSEDQIRRPLLKPGVALPEGVTRSDHFSHVSTVAAHFRRNNPGKDYFTSKAYNNPYKYAEENHIPVRKSATTDEEGAARLKELSVQDAPSTAAPEEMTSSTVADANVNQRAVRDSSAVGARSAVRGIRVSEFNTGQAK